MGNNEELSIITYSTVKNRSLNFCIDKKLIFSIKEEGIFFNHVDFPHFTSNDFVKLFIEILEKNFSVKFIEKYKNEKFVDE